MKVNPRTKEAYSLLHSGILAISKAEQQGIRVDMEYVEAKKIGLTRKIDRLEDEFKSTNFFKHWQHTSRGKVNIHSNEQLAHYIYDIKKIKIESETDSGQGSTNEEALLNLNIPELNLLLEVRKLKKIRDTYLDAFAREQVKGYIHPFFNLHIVKTYRSCVAKGTPILAVRDFIKHPKGVPIEEIKEGDYIYCFNNKLNPAIRKVLWAGKTGYKEVIRIHFSITGGGNGKGKGKGFLDVTPEHLIRLIDGSYVQAQNLIGDFRKSTESNRVPKIRTLSCRRSDDHLNFTGHLKQGTGISESHLVYEQLIGPLNKDELVHHKNLIHLDHTPSNLEKQTLEDHSRYHSLNASDEVKQKRIKALNDNRDKIVYKKGFENANSLKLTKFNCLKFLAENKGILTYINFDFDTFKKYCHLYQINIPEVKMRYDKHGNYIWKSQLLILSKKGRAHVQDILGYNHYRVLALYKLYNIPTDRKWGNQFGGFKPGNHIITQIEWIHKKTEVYDIEVEEFNNFFANEICVHNSSDSPNFQNIPKRDETAMQIVRRALFPRPGHQLIEVDYSGIEVRVAACYHKDETMLKYLRSDYDMHGDMAAQIFILDKYEKSKHYTLRQAAKNGFVFPEFYGDYYGNCAPSLACSWGKLPNGKWSRGEGIDIDTSNYTLGDHLISKGISSLKQFEEHIKKIEADFWGRRFADYANWKDTWYRLYQKYGYIALLTGFTCSGIMSKNDCINYPVQGAAFHCLLWSFIEVSKALEAGGFDSKLIGQIHDSMILDVNPNELEDVKKLVRKITTEDLPNAWKWIIIPMSVDIEISGVDASWAEKSKIN